MLIKNITMLASQNIEINSEAFSDRLAMIQSLLGVESSDTLGHLLSDVSQQWPLMSISQRYEILIDYVKQMIASSVHPTQKIICKVSEQQEAYKQQFITCLEGKYSVYEDGERHECFKDWLVQSQVDVLELQGRDVERDVADYWHNFHCNAETI